jgi:hypothetical protein
MVMAVQCSDIFFSCGTHVIAAEMTAIALGRPRDHIVGCMATRSESSNDNDV